MRNCQLKLFHVMTIWLWKKINSAIFACLKKSCAKIREFTCLRTSFIMYRDDWMLIKATKIRCLKRLIKALYYIVNDVFLSIFFFKFDNSAKCHISADSRRHCETTFRILFDFRCIVMFFSLSMKAYTFR